MYVRDEKIFSNITENQNHIILFFTSNILLCIYLACGYEISMSHNHSTLCLYLLIIIPWKTELVFQNSFQFPTLASLLHIFWPPFTLFNPSFRVDTSRDRTTFPANAPIQTWFTLHWKAATLAPMPIRREA